MSLNALHRPAMSFHFLKRNQKDERELVHVPNTCGAYSYICDERIVSIPVLARKRRSDSALVLR